MRRHRSSLFVPLVGFAAVLLGACGDDGQGVGTADTTTTLATTSSGGSTTSAGSTSSDSTTATSDASGTTDPSDPVAGDFFLEIFTGGGFVPPYEAFTELPSVTVYADGSTITQAAVAEIYPGPAVRPLTSGAIDDATISRLIDAAEAAGLLGDEPLDAGTPGVTDLPSTRVTITTGGATHRTVVYGLGQGDDDPHLTDEQRSARRAVQDFVEQAGATVTSGENGPYQPIRYRVKVVAPFGPEPRDMTQNHYDWPVAAVPLTEAPCLALEGDDAAALAAVLDEANQITVWISGGEDHMVAIRPVLPLEPTCP